MYYIGPVEKKFQKNCKKNLQSNDETERSIERVVVIFRRYIYRYNNYIRSFRDFVGYRGCVPLNALVLLLEEKKNTVGIQYGTRNEFKI